MLKLSASDIRKKWLLFFKSKKHLEFPSQSLIPVNDPSLLWINSGVATLKDFFSGIKTPPSNCLVSSQRCIRTNDIYNVGVTARHHTFFEMLGNFSIGDYFKEEAIEYGYEFLTKELKIRIEKLYITTFEEDDVAYDKWISLGINKKHIIKCGRDRNFWDVGQGPCGPCTEIYYDRGEKYDFNNIGEKLFFDDIENDRYVEIWNIVFSQYNNDGKNNYIELARKNIDTGAGLERLACISQDVPTNFDTDFFQPIILEIGKKVKQNNHYDINAYFDNKNYKQIDVNRLFRVIADHIKAVTFAIADGGQPSNKDRGSILRKLIRRSMVCGRKLGIEGSFLGDVSLAVINVMNDYYPYLNDSKNDVLMILEKEEKLFNQTLNKGFKLFESVVEATKKIIDTETVFKLVDTFGFPFEIILELAKENDLEIDENAFWKRFEQHQEVSRANVETKAMAIQCESLINFTDDSKFVYGVYELKNAKIIAIFDNEFNKKETTKNECWVVFDTTPIYATSGGQIHDVGQIFNNNDKFEIIDAIKGPNGQCFALIDPDGIKVSVGDNCDIFIDKQYRDNVSKNHSAEHLLEHVLNKYVSNNIKQLGAFKSPDRLTFDFALQNKLSDEQINLVQDKINEMINKGCPVITELVTLEEAKKNGAVSHFTEVYAKVKGKLRLVKMGDLLEICGGTHVTNLKDIEQFMIIKVVAKGGGLWRIEAITSNKTISDYLMTQAEFMQDEIFKIKEKVIELSINDEKLMQEISSLNFSLTPNNIRNVRLTFEECKKNFAQLLIKNEKSINEQKIVDIKLFSRTISTSSSIEYGIYHDEDIKNILSAYNLLANENKERAFVGINISQEKIQYVIICGTSAKIKANELISKINSLVSGKGGGNNFSAQGGTTQVDSVKKIIDFLSNQ